MVDSNLIVSGFTGNQMFAISEDNLYITFGHASGSLMCILPK